MSGRIRRTVVCGVAVLLTTAAVLQTRAHAARRSVDRAIAVAKPLIHAGRYAEADAVLRPALDKAMRQFGSDDLRTARVLNALGMVDKYTGRYGEGEGFYRRALAIVERSAPVDPLVVADILHNMGGLEHARERFADGEPFARRAAVGDRDVRSRVRTPELRHGRRAEQSRGDLSATRRARTRRGGLRARVDDQESAARAGPSLNRSNRGEPQNLEP